MWWLHQGYSLQHPPQETTWATVQRFHQAEGYFLWQKQIFLCVTLTQLRGLKQGRNVILLNCRALELQRFKGLKSLTRQKALNSSVSNCSVLTSNLMIYWCSLGLMSALLHRNGCIMALECKSILQDREHPWVQPAFSQSMPILLDDNTLTVYSLAYSASFKCDTLALEFVNALLLLR